jgi:hypothetical protein
LAFTLLTFQFVTKMKQWVRYPPSITLVAHIQSGAIQGGGASSAMSKKRKIKSCEMHPTRPWILVLSDVALGTVLALIYKL